MTLNSQPGLKALAARLLSKPRPAAIVGAIVCFSLSLTPSLLPRPWHVQGIVSGFAAAIGYGVGGGAGRVVRAAWRRPVSPSGILVSAVLAALGILVPLGWAVANFRWQLDVRRLMGMDTGITLYPFAMTITALITFCLLVVAGRVASEAYRALSRWASRLVPGHFGWAAKVLFGVLVFGVFIDVVLGDRVVGTFSRAYVAADARFDAGVQAPDSMLRSGGVDSLVSWDSLGRQGRRFVAGGPGAAQLVELNGTAAVEPIRVYSGLATARSPAERAEIAVAELERTGAFRRRALVVITPTGTGWIDPHGIDPVELMYNGDTAAVAVQYSYLPSWAAVIGNQDVASQAGGALFQAVRQRWEEEPEATRPLLLLYGESLGVFGSESAFSDLDEVRAQTDGALWVGPPRFTRLWRHFTFGRDPGSPVWQPVYQAGRAVRFGSDHESLLRPGGQWDRPRIVYLQHGSDPITWVSPDLLFNRPEWMDEPRNPGVSQKMFYVPVATFLQTTLDLTVSTGVPFGHGHSFGPGQAEAWALIAGPDGWSRADTTRLVSALLD